MTDVAVRRLRTSSTRADAEALLRRAVAEAPDRSVLIVRRLLVAGNDPDAARHRLAELRRTAARPTPGEVWPGWSTEAVLFEDEAQLLACLTADVTTGVAAQRWYWRPRLARGGIRPLMRVWMDAPRWLPAALEILEGVRPDLARAAVQSLAIAELRAVAVAVTEVGLRPPLSFGSPEPQPPAAAVAAPSAVAVARAPGGSLPPRPAEHRLPTLDRDIPGAAAHVAPEPAPAPDRTRAAQPLTGRAAPPEGRGPDARTVIASPAATEDPRGPTPAPRTHQLRNEPDPPASPPIGPAAAPALPPTGQTSRHREPPGIRAGSSAAPQPRADPAPARRAAVRRRRPIPDAPIDSQLAGIFYLLALTVRQSERGRTAGPKPTWTELAAFGRRVLRRHLDARRRADPLWTVLCALAARNHETGSATRGSQPWWPDALRFLASHDVGPSELMIPGLVGVTRTHVDVIFTLDQIDLRVRRAGLDQDPGWVPSARRIVSFHYL